MCVHLYITLYGALQHKQESNDWLDKLLLYVAWEN